MNTGGTVLVTANSLMESGARLHLAAAAAILCLIVFILAAISDSIKFTES
jgi:hypothetical protein